MNAKLGDSPAILCLSVQSVYHVLATTSQVECGVDPAWRL